MNNPYDILNKLAIPNDCLSLIFLFTKPIHPLCREIQRYFIYCDKCNEPLQSLNRMINLKYYTIEYGCGFCDKFKNKFVCKDCSIVNTCSCQNNDDDSCDSWYSWFSF